MGTLKQLDGIVIRCHLLIMSVSLTGYWQQFVDQLISEAALLGIHGSDLVKLIWERVREREETIHDNDKRPHEKLR